MLASIGPILSRYQILAELVFSLESVKCYPVGRIPLYSVYQTLSYEPNLTLLVPFPTAFAYLSMLFIFEVVGTGNPGGNQESTVGLDS